MENEFVMALVATTVMMIKISIITQPV